MSYTDQTSAGMMPEPGPRTVRAPRGTVLSCKGWQQEAATERPGSVWRLRSCGTLLGCL